MVDTVNFVQLFEDMSDSDYQQCDFPFLVDRKVNENGEIKKEFFDSESARSPLTGAEYNVRAIPAATGSPRRIAGYGVEINIPACLIGRNHQLVNGVPKAVEGAVELLRYFAAERGCSKVGIEAFSPNNCRLTAVTSTFLFEFPTPEETLNHLRELRNHADGIINHASRAPGRDSKKARPKCFTVGAEYFSMYIRQRGVTILAYIKQENVEKAFATFPSPEVKATLVEKALRTIRVEVTVQRAWLRKQASERPSDWLNKPLQYEKIFNLAREALRLDDGLRVRAPTEAVISKLPSNAQIALRAHLDGMNIREHQLVQNSRDTVDQMIGAESRRYSALKRAIMADAGVDISIPWAIQSTMLSPHLKDWFRYPGEFEPDENVKEHVFSRVSAPKAITALRGKTARFFAPRYAPGICDVPV